MNGTMEKTSINISMVIGGEEGTAGWRRGLPATAPFLLLRDNSFL